MSNTLTAVFARNHSLGSVLIRVLGAWGGQWSHCAIVDKTTNSVIEARYPMGVVETPLVDFLIRYSKYEFVEIECPNPDKAIAFARNELGKKYDLLGLLGFIIKEPIARLQEWFCNELLEDSIIAGDRIRFRVPSRKITVEQSFRVK